MTEAEVRHMHQDLEMIRQDISLIKHILMEENELSVETKKRLEKARNTQFSEFKKL